jgi:hypothetical protein
MCARVVKNVGFQEEGTVTCSIALVGKLSQKRIQTQ